MTLLSQYRAKPMFMNDSDIDPLKILIIDEDRDFANILNALFRGLNYKAYTTYNEKHATAKLQKIIPDLLFCDMGLANRGSYRIANKVRMDMSLNHIFLVAMTRHIDKQCTAFDMRYDSCITKPVQTAVLNIILDEVELRKASYRRHETSMRQ